MHRGEAGDLEQRDEVVGHGRDDDPHQLRRDRPVGTCATATGPAPAPPASGRRRWRAGRRGRSRRRRRPRSGTGRAAAAMNGVNQVLGECRDELRQRVPDEQQLDQRGDRPEDPDVGPGERPHAPASDGHGRARPPARCRARRRTTTMVSTIVIAAPWTSEGERQRRQEDRGRSSRRPTARRIGHGADREPAPCPRRAGRLYWTTSRMAGSMLYLAAIAASVPFVLERREAAARASPSSVLPFV